jgi:methionyl-tRNA formyltransferase
MRIVFFGTPYFAVPSLKALLAGGSEVLAVITQPDRPQGRSRSQLVPSPIKVIAEDLGIPVLQPDRPVGDVFAERLRRLDPDLGVVVAYGHILKPEILQIPREGMINVHASLLPRLRGAAPIQWAILNGEQETGVSTMVMEEGLDSGPVYQRAPLAIGNDETAGELLPRLAQLGAAVLMETVSSMAHHTRPVPQDDKAATYAPKIDRALCRIRWAESAGQSSRRVRAFDPEPGAWTTFQGAEIKLFGASPHDVSPAAEPCPPGAVLQVGDRLSIMTGQGALLVREVQPAGKKRMTVGAWIQGRQIQPGQRFE